MRWMISVGLIASAGLGTARSLNLTDEALRQSIRPEVEPSCAPASTGRPLPPELRETSGLAWSGRGGGVLWTHNDSGNEPIVYAVDTGGTLLQQVTVTDAMLMDWEDIEAGPCDGGTCLFVADIGDNRKLRETVTVYRIPEPKSSARASERAVAFSLKYPDGAQDAESLFMLPDGDLYIVTKGRHAGVVLYRLPKAQQKTGTTLTLERVRTLWPRARRGLDMVTSATASPNGRWVAIRSYRTMYLYRTEQLISPNGGVTPIEIDLRPLNEKQGEAVLLSNDGVVWLTSEAERKRDSPVLSRMSCGLNN